MIIVRLVVLVPLIACVHSVEVLGLAWPVLVMPPVHLHNSHTWVEQTVINSNNRTLLFLLIHTIMITGSPQCLLLMHVVLYRWNVGTRLRNRTLERYCENQSNRNNGRNKQCFKRRSLFCAGALDKLQQVTQGSLCVLQASVQVRPGSDLPGRRGGEGRQEPLCWRPVWPQSHTGGCKCSLPTASHCQNWAVFEHKTKAVHAFVFHHEASMLERCDRKSLGPALGSTRAQQQPHLRKFDFLIFAHTCDRFLWHGQPM